MGRAVRWVGILSGFILAIIVAFTVYAHFLMDYSLESLEFALSAAGKKPQETTQLSARMYENLVQDLALKEASDDEGDLRNFSMLELAARSFNEAAERAGHERAKLYLTKTMQLKLPERHIVLIWFDNLYKGYRKLSYQFMQFVTYLQSQLSPEPDEPLNVSSYLLLTQAEEKEREWNLDEAAELYRKFLNFYPDHQEYAVVSISLSQVLMKQKRYNEAERVLRGLALSGIAVEEYQIASALLKRIGDFREREKEIRLIEDMIADSNDQTNKEELKLKLALLHLYSYSMNEAQKILYEIKDSKDSKVRAKAKFYMGWIYKLQCQYDQGARVFLELAQSEDVDEELSLGANAQLADIYYKEGEREKSYDYYEKINSKQGDDKAREASKEAWAALADAEQAAISHFDFNDSEKAKKHLDSLESVFPGFGEFSDLRSAMENAPQVDLRDLAFTELQSGRVLEALDLFKKKISQDPKDAWAHAGMADVYVLLTDLYSAGLFAEKGFELGADQFTATVLGYVKAYQGRLSEAVELYKSAVIRDPEYVPGQYNLATVYIQQEDYENALEVLTGLERAFGSANNTMKSKVLNNLGITLWQLGRGEEASQKFKEALEIVPDFEDAQINLNYVLGRGLSQTIPASGE